MNQLHGLSSWQVILTSCSLQDQSGKLKLHDVVHWLTSRNATDYNTPLATLVAGLLASVATASITYTTMQWLWTCGDIHAPKYIWYMYSSYVLHKGTFNYVVESSETLSE